MSRSISVDGKRGLTLFLVAIMAISTLGAGAALASPSDDIDLSDDSDAPNPHFDVDTLTVASHPMEEGASDSAMAGYYDDDGNWVSSPEFEVNTTSNAETGDNVNPYTFNPAHVQEDTYGLFPRTGDANNSASALDASEWTTDASGTAGSGSVSDTEVAENVDAVNIATSSQTSGDTYVASYSNWTSELDSDESKRVIQLAGDVNTLESGATVDINITDESGDVKTVVIDPSANVDTGTNVAANSTGSFVYQIKLNQLTTTGGGDWANIESIDVNVHDANADVSLAWADLEKKGKTALGKTTVDSDADGTYDETETLYNATGSISVNSMETLDSTYDDAVINDVSMPVTFDVAMMEGEEGVDADYNIEWESADQYPGFDTVLNASYRMDLPTAIDLSYSGVDLQWEQDLPSDRYITAAVAENVAEDTNLTDASLSSFSGSLGSPGDLVTIDSTISTGDDYVTKFEVKLTENEQSAIQAVGGGAAPAGGSGGGNIVDFLFSLPGMLIGGGATILGYLGLKGRS